MERVLNLENTIGQRQNKMAKLSLCMIVKDESDFLKKCLDSVKPIVDEIIVVDTGSKDRTVEVAESFGAKVIKHKWNNNFSEARNVSLKHATGDWILVLDADETISEGDLPKIRKLMEKDVDAFALIQRNYFKDRKPTALELSAEGDAYKDSKSYDGWFPSPLVRLFRNNKGYEFTGIIHELIEPSIKQKGGMIKTTSIPIHHFGLEKGADFDTKKKQSYLELGKKQIKLAPNNPKPYYEVGTIYLTDKEYDKAIKLFEKGNQAIESSTNPNEHIRTSGYLNYGLGISYLKKERYEDAIKCFNIVLKNNPENAVSHFFLAQAYTMLNKLKEAIKEYRIAIKLNPKDEENYNNLANLYARTGQFDKAILEFKAALELSPENATIHRNLGAVYFGMKKWADAYKFFKKAVELNHEFEKELGEVIKQLVQVKDRSYDPTYSFSVG